MKQQEFKHNFLESRIQNAKHFINKICRVFSSTRLYTLYELRKTIKDLRYRLSDDFTVKNIRKVVSILSKNLPHAVYVNKSVVGRVIIDHISNDLKKQIIDVYVEEEVSFINDVDLSTVSGVDLNDQEN